MIQDIFPHRFDNHYEAELIPGNNDTIFHYQGNTLLMKVTGEELSLPTLQDIGVKPSEAIYLFQLNETACFLVNELAEVPAGMEYKEISFFRTIEQREIGFVALVGYHLSTWYAQHQYCGRCGSKAHHKHDERAMSCPACGLVNYPKISPAIIVGIISDDKILLARNSNFTGGWYSLIAGYADVGETLEQTVIREVKEEVGIDVRNIRYYKSQPWPLSGSMMVGFLADADPAQPIRIDEHEITAAEWFSRDELPAHPSNVSIAGEIIEQFEKGNI